MAYRIVVAQPIEAEIIAQLSAHGPVFMNPGPDPLSPSDLRQKCAEAEAVMAFMTERIDADFLDACPNLKIVAGAFKGFDNVDLDACRAKGVEFTYVPDLLTKPTAELTLGLMISLCRNMRAGDAHNVARAGHRRSDPRRSAGGRGDAGQADGAVSRTMGPAASSRP